MGKTDIKAKNGLLKQSKGLNFSVGSRIFTDAITIKNFNSGLAV